MSRYLGFIGPTYALKSVKADCQRAVNCYPETNESGSSPDGGPGILRGIPGLSKKATLGTGPIRGIFYTSNGYLAVMSGRELYIVDPSTFAYTLRGTIASTSGPVRFSDNGTQLIMVDGVTGYVLTSFATTGSLEQITDADFTASDVVVFHDGYFITNNKGTGEFLYSSLYDGTSWDGLDFSSAEGLPDRLISLLPYQHQVWLFGAESTEVYWNSGDADNPFSRVEGAFMEIGCAAPHSVAKAGGSVLWLTNTGYIAACNSYSPQRVSNYGVELAIRQAGDLSEAKAYTYSHDGHYFYVLDIPGAPSQWVFDLTTSVWHERCELQGASYVRSRCIWHTNTPDGIVCGSSENGEIYQLDDSVYTLDGDPIPRERTAPHLVEGNRRVFIHKFELLLEVGIGLDGGVHGEDPQIMLQISRDGGYTWGDELWRSAGRIGEFHHRAVWRALGWGRDLVYRIRMTDPVKFQIIGADIEVEGGAS